MHASGLIIRRYAPVVAVVIVCVLLFTYHLGSVDSLPLFGDESHWIGKSKGWFLLIHGRFDEPFWKLEAIDQPLLVPYLFGAVASLSGYDGSMLHRMYDFSKDFETNRKEGRVPNPALLRRCRIVSLACGIVGVGAAMAILWRIVGPGGSLAVPLLLGLNPHYIRLSQRAMSEGMLSLWLLVGWLICMALAHTLDKGPARSARRWSILMGVVAGLGLTTKLTGLVIFIGMGVVGAWIALRTVIAGRRPGQGSGWRLPAVHVGVAFAVGYLVFIAQSPATWNDPLGALQRMMSWRKGVTAQQQVALPEYAIHGMYQRVGKASVRLGHDIGTLGASGVSRWLHIPWLDGLLFLAGLLWLVAAERRARLAGDARYGCDLGVSLIWSGVLLGSLALFLEIDNDRYYLPGLIALVVVQATALGAASRWVGTKIGRLRADSALSRLHR